MTEPLRTYGRRAVWTTRTTVTLLRPPVQRYCVKRGACHFHRLIRRDRSQIERCQGSYYYFSHICCRDRQILCPSSMTYLWPVKRTRLLRVHILKTILYRFSVVSTVKRCRIMIEEVYQNSSPGANQ